MLARSGKISLTQRSREAFTLLEVLVVVSIVVILASLATFAATRYMRDARINQASLQMQKIETAIKAYHLQSGRYPDSLEELVQRTEAGPPLLEGGPAAITDPWGNIYQFSPGVIDSFGNERVMISTTTNDGQPLQWPKN